MKYLLYIPGFKSQNEQSQSFQFLKETFGKDYTVKCLHYENLDPTVAYNQISDEIEKVNTEYNTVILVAQSLGGYWGNMMSVKYNLPVVLINPSLTPYISLLRHPEFTVKVASQFNPSPIGVQPKLVFLSIYDEIIDIKYVERFYENVAQFEYLHGSHRLTLDDLDHTIIHIKTFLSHILA